MKHVLAITMEDLKAVLEETIEEPCFNVVDPEYKKTLLRTFSLLVRANCTGKEILAEVLVDKPNKRPA